MKIDSKMTDEALAGLCRRGKTFRRVAGQDPKNPPADFPERISINESIIEEAALEWFGKLGYAVGHGPHLAPGEPAARRTARSGSRTSTERISAGN